MFLMLPAIAVPDAPVAPGWWPPPVGWWLLALGIFMVLIWGAYFAWRHFFLPVRARQSLSVRVQALVALDELMQRRELDARTAAYRLSEILRAALLDEAQTVAVADTSGEAGAIRWPFAVCDGVIGDKRQWEGFWRELDMRYQPAMQADEEAIERWIALARGWIGALPTDVG